MFSRDHWPTEANWRQEELVDKAKPFDIPKREVWEAFKLNQALVRNVRTCRSDAKGDIQVAHTARIRVPMRSTGAEQLVVGKKAL